MSLSHFPQSLGIKNGFLKAEFKEKIDSDFKPGINPVTIYPKCLKRMCRK